MSGVFSRRGAQPPKAPPPPPAAPAEADPSMEDILASIRRILNEGETETAEAPVEVTAEGPVETVAAAPMPEPVAAAPAEQAPAPVANVQPQVEVVQQNASET